MLNWTLKTFQDLTVDDLYAIMRLRNEVFVVEQTCIYQDADNIDQVCYHLMGWQDDKLIAYTRIVPPGGSYEEPSIGRVVTSPVTRGDGIGRELMERSIDHVVKLYGDGPIKIGAQAYLLQFYLSLGFQQTSDLYLEDGIMHVEMVLFQPPLVP